MHLMDHHEELRTHEIYKTLAIFSMYNIDLVVLYFLHRLLHPLSILMFPMENSHQNDQQSSVIKQSTPVNLKTLVVEEI